MKVTRVCGEQRDMSDAPTVTAAELRSFGIDPDCPVGNPRKVVGQPVRLRFGDDLIERSSSGAVCKCYGYFTESQVRARARMAEYAARVFRELT